MSHTPTMVNAVSPLDTIRIECLGEGRAVTMPAAAWLETRDRHKSLIEEVTAVLGLLDGLAQVWGDEGVSRRCRDRLRVAVSETPADRHQQPPRGPGAARAGDQPPVGPRTAVSCQDTTPGQGRDGGHAMSRTPTPWRVQTTGNTPGLLVETDDTENPRVVADFVGDDLMPAAECRANATFAVRACNAHDALLAACRAMLARHETAYAARVNLTGITGGGISNEIEQAKAAIQLATEGVRP